MDFCCCLIEILPNERHQFAVYIIQLLTAGTLITILIFIFSNVFIFALLHNTRQKENVISNMF